MSDPLSYYATIQSGDIDLDDLMAFHRSRFGGFRMEDAPDDEDDPPADEPPSDEEEPPSEDDPSDEPEDEGESEESEDDLPDWARARLTKANKEAATYRTRLRAAEEQLTKATSPEDVEALRQQLTEEREEIELNLLKENIALRYRLPEKLAARLVGKTKEELEEDAKSLSEFTQEEEVEIRLSGGLRPNERDSDPDDPGELARKYGRGRRRPVA